MTGPTTPGRTNRRALVLALGGVALALLVIGFLLTRPHDATPAAPTTAPTSDATTATATATGDGGLAAPAVAATPKVGAVEFRWSSPAQASTDTYLVHVGPTADEAQIADPVTLTRATYTVKSPSGSQVCLLAAVVRAGRTSPASPTVCGTAQ